MQGSFPIAPRPYQHVAAEAGDHRGRGARPRPAPARRADHPPGHADLRHPGAGLLLDAGGGQGRPREPVAGGQRSSTPTPGVSHNYLRNHEFNIWFTIATEPDSPLGLEGTLDVLGEIAGAESIRQLPTLKLFKIRMDLEMEGGTEALAKAAEAVAPAETEPQPYDEFDRAVIRALQGDMPVISEPYAPAAEQLGIPRTSCSRTCEGMQERRLLRRVAAILFHRRAGFSANGMGVWKVPDERIMELGPRMAAFRGISHCYQRPTYEDWPYSVFTMAHGRSKEECDAILDSIAESDRDHRALDALLLDRVQEDPAALLHRGLPRLGTRARRRVSGVTMPSAKVVSAPSSLAPSSTSGRSGCCPAASTRRSGRCARSAAIRSSSPPARGRDLRDVDGNDYIDWVVLVGAADPRSRRPRRDRGGHRGRGTRDDVRRADRGRGRAGRRGRAADPVGGDAAHDLLGHRGHDERHPPGPGGHRPGEGAQVRRRLPRPRRRPAGRGRLRAGHPGDPGQPGRPRGGRECHGDRALERPRRAGRGHRAHELAAILAEPVPANMGVVPAAAGFLELLRERGRAPARCWSSTRSSAASGWLGAGRRSASACCPT